MSELVIPPTPAPSDCVQVVFSTYDLAQLMAARLGLELYPIPVYADAVDDDLPTFGIRVQGHSQRTTPDPATHLTDAARAPGSEGDAGDE